jgi:hypothetical protein
MTLTQKSSHMPLTFALQLRADMALICTCLWVVLV